MVRWTIGRKTVLVVAVGVIIGFAIVIAAQSLGERQRMKSLAQNSGEFRSEVQHLPALM
jgi:uncharacterized membrane protein (DUF106 family)